MRAGMLANNHPCGEKGGAVMCDNTNCPHCGAPGYGPCEFYGIPDEMACLRRQLAAANERAGRLEAQMVELREAYAVVEFKCECTPKWKCPSHEADATFERILGGA